MKDWLENENTKTSEPITLEQLRAAEQKGFQQGIELTLATLKDDTDFEPYAIHHVCFTCYKTESLTDAEAESKGWSKDACPDCSKVTVYPENLANRPYFQRTLTPERKVEKIGGVRV
jgi:hypothetical protein